MEKLKREDIKTLSAQLQDGWEVAEERILRREFKFSDFLGALAFVNKLGGMAEEMRHHPDLHLSYGQVTVEFTTHEAGGLTEKDFEAASRIDML
ncbi:MAG: 4a-hydroxytetrahydrobiopterin dehydratase [bacterium]|nr:4a-hydroxytetrahydrobiopterin dehydratase [bacterium]MDZ4231974.1 4a-hydroxytetrahydrobiopterin dehydratase [Candidatus Pacearchaeota archaeon]